MGSRSITLDLPEELYDRAQQLAAIGERRVEDFILSELSAALHSPEPVLAHDEEAELAALRFLSDDALWTIARETLPADSEARLRALLAKRGRLTGSETEELASLIERGDRLMLRRAEAAAVLTSRGFRVTPDSLTASHG